jgi:uncharacterized protein (TIGR03067 family)
MLTTLKPPVLVCLMFGILSTAGGASAAEGAKAAVKAELKKLVGTWKVQAVESDGRTARDEDIKGLRYVIGADGKWELRKDDQTQARGTFTIDPTKKPKTIDFKIEESISEQAKGKMSLGIYELDGDNLKVCRDWPGEGARPTELSAAAQSKRILGEYKRVKKP